MTGYSWVRGESGFSLMEMLVVVSLVAIGAGIAMPLIGQWGPALQSDGALRVVMGLLVQARETAITQRRDMQVTFTNGNQVQIIREEVPPPATTLIANQFLESNVQFALIPGVPDTPDAFGNANPISFGAAATIQFSPDGMLLDQAGNPVNGTVFVAATGVKVSARAATIMGATGRIRGYRWNGVFWKLI